MYSVPHSECQFRLQCQELNNLLKKLLATYTCRTFVVLGFNMASINCSINIHHDGQFKIYHDGHAV